MLALTQAAVPVAAHSIDVAAIAGIVGTLLGTALGALVAWRIQQSQIKHEDETRFHDRRLAVYAEYNDACGKVFASRLATGAHSLENMARVLTAYETLRLVASKPVAVAAMQVHSIVVQLAVPTLSNGQAAAGALSPQFNSSLAALGNAMRTELGIANV